eukprot:gnl/Dysnectes_brevis/2371_a2800_875.p1 GENE.gnl/Dysnectes_brevis/2371_a2800_875~~gnl/Dysnectes_brevis/2371_a2800_875.p1  ORF type:complete len:293 (-),score=80.35 gnl/Dysnectes_brevis/2371_a2800_875:187-1065(-)
MALIDREVRFTLDPNYELNIEVPTNKSVTVKLLEGVAEIRGWEIPRQMDEGLSFSGCSLGVLAPNAQPSGETCTISLKGDPETIEEAYITPSHQPQLLERVHRLHIGQKTQINPFRLAIVGRPDSGALTALHTLAAWATRKQVQPLLVSLDPEHGLAMPGVLTAAQADQFPAWAADSPNKPLELPLGIVDPGRNEELMRVQVERLLSLCTQRLACDPSAMKGGLLVKLPPLTERTQRAQLMTLLRKVSPIPSYPPVCCRFCGCGVPTGMRWSSGPGWTPTPRRSGGTSSSRG